MKDILRGLLVLLTLFVVLAIGIGIMTLIGACVGLAWNLLCRAVPIALVCVIVLGGIIGIVWLIGRVARMVCGNGDAP